MSLQLIPSAAELQINCERKGRVGLNEDESYQLSIVSNKITINATTDLRCTD
jgi:hexosaminidase